MVRTPPDRKVVGAGPVGSGHGSYQLVSWWGGQCWCPPMAHAQWWQSGSAIRDVARRTHGSADVRFAARPPCDSVLRELRLRGAIRDVYSCMHSWARKSLVLCFAFGHLGVLFVSVASGISRRAYLLDVPRYFPSFSLRWSLTKQPHRYPLGTISIPISVLFNPLCL